MIAGQAGRCMKLVNKYIVNYGLCVCYLVLCLCSNYVLGLNKLPAQDNVVCVCVCP